MTEINKAALAQETRLIEYWRKKYLFQAAAVAVCAGAAIAAAAVYIMQFFAHIFHTLSLPAPSIAAKRGSIRAGGYFCAII